MKAIFLESSGKHTVCVGTGGIVSGIYICELKSNATAKRLKLGADEINKIIW